MSKPIPAIVERAAIDVEALEAQIVAALGEHRQAERSISILEAELGTARGAAKMRRIELGTLLAKIRGAWPKAGPKAKGWSELLARLKLDDSTAHRYIDEATDPAGFSQRREKPAAPRDDDQDNDGQTGPRIVPDPDRPRETPPFRQLGADDLIQSLARLPPAEQARVLRAGKANVAGGSGEPDRGTWCTPKALAVAVGAWDLDPFSNPRSHVAAAHRCQLENSGDGFGDGSGAGSFRVSNRPAEYAGPEMRVWLQPPYERRFMLDVVDHYKHTRFCALLRWSPDTEWFARLWPHVRLIAFLRGERMEFEPPPGLEASSNPYPHALYYADERDVTDEVRAMCIVWRVDHSSDPPSDPSGEPITERVD